MYCRVRVVGFCFPRPLSVGLRKQLVLLLAVQNYVFGEQEGSFCHSTYVPIPGKILVYSLPYASNRLL